MDWYGSVVIISADNRVGSGVLLDPSTVLTAAHVLAPGGNGTLAGSIVVEFPWLSYAQSKALKVQVHPDWKPGALHVDFATIRIAPGEARGLATGAMDQREEAFLYGYPASPTDPMHPQSSFQSGFLQRDGLKLYSDGFHVMGGMSGSPFVQMMNGATRIVGLATWDADTPTAGGFKGLPIDSAYLSGVWPMSST